MTKIGISGSIFLLWLERGMWGIVCHFPKFVATNNYIDYMPLPQTALYGS
jgi:hypothetical protein